MHRKVALGFVVLLVALGAASGAQALQQLPFGGQVNDDLTAGIDPTLSVSGEDPSNSDVTGGSLAVGGRAVPWAVLRQQEAGGARDQVFARSFAGGAWTTRGNGTVGGAATPKPFGGSLNFDQSQDAEAPAIDFAGAGRTVPWATWYENVPAAGFAANNIFASRFDNSGDSDQGKWLFAGQARSNPARVPSLNIHPTEPAENPSVAGGSGSDPSKPAPWVTWQERDGSSLTDQIFVVRGEGPGMNDCTGILPAGANDMGAVPAVGGFCWQQVGIPRVETATDPSLNVDPTRAGNEPDIAFTGPVDAVPWVVWYESGNSGIGLHGSATDMVFAAKAVGGDGAANGGFHWVVVGSAAQGTLDTSGTSPHNIGSCGLNSTSEERCSLNKNAASGSADDPRVAAGTMTPGAPTVPWVAWDENDGANTEVFVARLTGSGASATFQIANHGAPISAATSDATRPDITFSHNTPYVTWRQDAGGGAEQTFAGHFVNAADPTFVLDTNTAPLTPRAEVDVREPISSSCTANPFTNDGANCPGGALGTPFFLFTNGPTVGPHSLFADAYVPDAPVTGTATGVTESSATLNATVDPHGTAANVVFEYGPTTAYGQNTGPQPIGVTTGATPFSAVLNGLPPGVVFHFRADATSDFGTVFGPDQTFATTPVIPSACCAPPPSDGTASIAKPTVTGTTATTKLTCAGAASAQCRVKLELEVTETLRGHTVIAVAAASHHKKPKVTHQVVVVGSKSLTLSAGHSATEHVALNTTGKHLLSVHHTLHCKLLVIATLANGHHTTVKTTTVTFKAPSHKKKHHHR